MEERIYHLQSSAQESRLQLGEQKATLMAHATELRADLKVMRDRMDTMTRRVEEVERIGRKIVKGLRTEAREGIDEVRRYVRQQQANPLIGQTSYSSTLHGTLSLACFGLSIRQSLHPARLTRLQHRCRDGHGSHNRYRIVPLLHPP
mmetsp:Transcript_48204/g.126013  ORF Transcript_48204/g.126013 Transcript_48204/m.126013 type:complete len:147 (+) Transcript_48204:93-533(+)